MLQRQPEPMLPTTTHDEQALQDFVRDFRRFLRLDVMPGASEVYAQEVGPALARDLDGAPPSYHDIRPAMMQNGYYQLWSALQRRSQELMWESVTQPTERELDELIARYLDAAKRTPAGGSLTLDSKLDVPSYHTAVDIHLQPGGYHTEFVADDISAGSLYLGGFPIYIDGELGPMSDGIGHSLVSYLQREYPDFVPEQILDMGCAVGNSTLPWADAFPNAALAAIDVAAPCLRFAHARAELLGAKVDFSQQNAEATRFEAQSFDLIVSHIVLHETSRTALSNILDETYRLLRPGGLMLHLDVPRGDTAFGQFMSQWETYNNNEVFSAYMTDVDLLPLAKAAGFDPATVKMGAAMHGDGVQHSYSDTAFAWPVLVGRK